MNWYHKNLNTLLEELSIINLKNMSAEIKDNLWLVGFDDGPTGNPDLSILNTIPKDTSKISIFDSGWFEVESTKMYVSRGIGNSILSFRFNCRPEVAFITVHY